MPAALSGLIAPATHELIARSGVSGPDAQSRPPAYKAVGLTLAVASGLFIGVSFVLKKVGLLKANVKYNEEAGEGYGYLKNVYWWSGMTLMIIGEICNFVAYAFVDAILVTPLGALSVVVTTILSAIFLKERLSFVGKVGCFICIIGSIIIVLNAPEQSSAANIQQMQGYVIHPGFLTYAGVIIIGCGIVAFYVGPRYGKKSMMVYLTVCSLIGGLSVVATQGLGAAVVAQAGGEQQFNQWFLYVLFVFVIATLLTEIIYLNKALNLFNAALVTPTYYVYFTSSTIVASAVLFRGFKGTPLSIATIIMGFLQICAGVILLQLSKSAKDVPDTAVLNGDLDQIRTVGEQEQPESEPQADALRGAAALLRRISVVRQKREQDEARRVYEDRMRDKMETLGEGEKVEWDGVRRRKTIVGEPGSLSRRKTVHPPLGLTKFPSYEDPMEAEAEAEDDPEPGIARRGTGMSFFANRPRRETSSSRITFGTPFSPRVNIQMDPSETIKTVPGEQLEMQHVYGLPGGLRSDSASHRSNSQGKPIMWATDVEDKPKLERPGGLDGAGAKGPAKRQFSFQNIFHKNRDEHRKQDPTRLTVTTEEERLGLTRGDSSNASDEDDITPAMKTLSRSAEQLTLPISQTNLTLQDHRKWNNSSPEIRTPGNGRPLPDLPAEDGKDDFEKDFKDIEGYESNKDSKGKGT